MKKALLIILITLGALVLLAAGAAFFTFRINEWNLSLNVEPTEISIEYGTTPNLGQATATVTCSLLKFVNIDVPVQVEGTGDSYDVGTYTFTYSAQYRSLNATATQTLTVTDTVPPTITLTPETAEYILPNEEYVDAGYSASDNRDGDITDRVVREDAYDKIIYTVADESGNEATAERSLNRCDPIPPTLTLEGDAEMEVDAYYGYSEPGYSAQDNVDGDLTSAVSIDTDLNAAVSGTYTITYTVADAAGNTASAQRKVTVYTILDKYRTLPDVLPEKNGCTIYLTFDDGPSGNTRALLDVLDKYGVKATFFVTGSGDSSIIAEEAARGHAIGLHTYSHVYSSIYASEEAYFDDLQRISDLVYAQTGTTTSLIRFPGGSSNTVSRSSCPGLMTRLVEAIAERGYTYFDWNVSSGDAGGTTSTEGVFRNVINGVTGKTAAVVLQHDSHGFSTRAVEYIIIWGLSNGYSFAPLTADSPTAHHGVNN